MKLSYEINRNPNFTINLTQKRVAGFLFKTATLCSQCGLDPNSIMLDDPFERRIQRESTCRKCGQYYLNGGPCENNHNHGECYAHCLDHEMVGYKNSVGRIEWRCRNEVIIDDGKVYFK